MILMLSGEISPASQQRREPTSQVFEPHAGTVKFLDQAANSYGPLGMNEQPNFKEYRKTHSRHSWNYLVCGTEDLTIATSISFEERRYGCGSRVGASVGHRWELPSRWELCPTLSVSFPRHKPRVVEGITSILYSAEITRMQVRFVSVMTSI